MPVKSKVKFNGQGLKSRFDNLRDYTDWAEISVYGLLGLIVVGIGTGIGAGISEATLESEIEDGRSLVLDEKTYELVDENSVSTSDDSLSYEYNFEARVVVIKELNEEGETIDRTMIRFEDSGTPDKIERARKAGVQMADQLKAAFEDARDRWFFNDEEIRKNLIEDAQDFKAQYGATKIVPTPSPNGGQ